MTAPDFSGDFVRVPRVVIETLIGDPVPLQVYLVCSDRARYKRGIAPRRYIDLDVGQAVFGREELAKVCKTTAAKVRRALTLLESLGFLAIQTTSRGTIVTVCGLLESGHAGRRNSPAESPADDQPIASVQPADDQPIATNEEGRREEREKEEGEGERAEPPEIAPSEPQNRERTARDVAHDVLQKLEERAGVPWTEDGAALDLVAAQLDAAVAELDLVAVIDYCAAAESEGGKGWAGSVKMRGNLSPFTILAPGKIEKYLTLARAWSGGGSEEPQRITDLSPHGRYADRPACHRPLESTSVPEGERMTAADRAELRDALDALELKFKASGGGA